MVKHETIEIAYHRCTKTMASINQILTQLFDLIEKTPKDRVAIARELSNLRSEAKALSQLIETIDDFVKKTNQDQIMSQLPFELSILYAFIAAWGNATKNQKNNMENFASQADVLGKDIIRKNSLDNYWYSEQEILEKLYELISDMKTYMHSLEMSIEKELYQRSYGKAQHIPITLIVDLVTFKIRDWPGLDDKWACAACYLASLEVAVNKACKEWNIKEKDDTRIDEFKKKLDAITQIMKQRGLEVIKIEKDIVSRLYDYRNRVLHGGYIPNDEEFAYIVKIIPKFIQDIQKARK